MSNADLRSLAIPSPCQGPAPLGSPASGGGEMPYDACQKRRLTCATAASHAPRASWRQFCNRTRSMHALVTQSHFHLIVLYAAMALCYVPEWKIGRAHV